MFSLLTNEVILGSWRTVLKTEKDSMPGTCLITNKRIAFYDINLSKELYINKDDISSIKTIKGLFKSRLYISINGYIYIFEKKGLPVKLMADLLKI
jgi:hypothetical protein